MINAPYVYTIVGNSLVTLFLGPLYFKMSGIPGTQQLRFRKPSKPSTARSPTIPTIKVTEAERLLKENPTVAK